MRTLTFLEMALAAGANCLITDPVRMALSIRAADLLQGRDPDAMRYSAYYRAHKQEAQSQA